MTFPHPDSASPLFQHLIVDACRSDPKLLVGACTSRIQFNP
jgi:hypothetical protein